MSFSDLTEIVTTAQQMMNKIKMKYKDFEFPSNPSVMEVKSKKLLGETSLCDKHFLIEEGCCKPLAVSGSGVFYGEEGREACVFLSRLLRQKNSGWLFCPDASPIKAYMTEFSYTIDSKKGCCSYSFEFIEAENPAEVKRNFDFAIAQNGDNAFTIANRENVSPTAIMKLNDYKTPFEITQGESVRIR